MRKTTPRKGSTCTLAYESVKDSKTNADKLQSLFNKTKVLHTAFSVETRLADKLILQ